MNKTNNTGNVTKNIATYISDNNINLSELARKSGITYSLLYYSLGHKNRTRELRASELVKICSVLNINPMDFAD
ncbi:MAG: helix-turn-helix transcriptional regulator [Lachnospiraceae bacterium]|nr:helix-turn-helix transcriptional regulator [Lachnospiraceae bacterium]